MQCIRCNVIEYNIRFYTLRTKKPFDRIFHTYFDSIKITNKPGFLQFKKDLMFLKSYANLKNIFKICINQEILIQFRGTMK